MRDKLNYLQRTTHWFIHIWISKLFRFRSFWVAKTRTDLACDSSYGVCDSHNFNYFGFAIVWKEVVIQKLWVNDIQSEKNKTDWRTLCGVPHPLFWMCAAQILWLSFAKNISIKTNEMIRFNGFVLHLFIHSVDRQLFVHNPDLV